MAEADDLKSSQCGFESHWGYQFLVRRVIGAARLRSPRGSAPWSVRRRASTPRGATRCGFYGVSGASDGTSHARTLRAFLRCHEVFTTRRSERHRVAPHERIPVR